MPKETQDYLKKHNISEYETEKFELAVDSDTDSTLSLRAIDPKDIINFMPDLESRSEAQLILLIKRVIHQMEQEKIPMVMEDFRNKLMYEIQNSQLIHREQRPALSRAILSNTLEIFDQPKRMPILPYLIIAKQKVGDDQASKDLLKEFKQIAENNDAEKKDFILANWASYEVLSLLGEEKEAKAFLENAYFEVKSRSRDIKNKSDRNKYLSSNFHSKINDAWSN